MHKNGISALVAIFISALTISATKAQSSYTATEAYVKNAVAAEAKRADKAIINAVDAVRQETSEIYLPKAWVVDPVDATSVVGMAADAKKTGIALTNLQYSVDEIENRVIGLENKGVGYEILSLTTNVTEKAEDGGMQYITNIAARVHYVKGGWNWKMPLMFEELADAVGMTNTTLEVGSCGVLTNLDFNVDYTYAYDILVREGQEDSLICYFQVILSDAFPSLTETNGHYIVGKTVVYYDALLTYQNGEQNLSTISTCQEIYEDTDISSFTIEDAPAYGVRHRNIDTLSEDGGTPSTLSSSQYLAAYEKEDGIHFIDRLIENGGAPSDIELFTAASTSQLFSAISTLEEQIDDALAGKADKSDVDPLLFAQYYPEGNVKSAAEFTAGIKYDAPDTTSRTIFVMPFCYTGTSTNDNSSLVGRVVIPPFVDAQGNPYISDNGTRFKVVGVSDGSLISDNDNLTAIVAPSTVTTIGNDAFIFCTALTSISLPAATTIGNRALDNCRLLTSVSLPAASTIGNGAFDSCTALTSVYLPSATTFGEMAFFNCTNLTSVSFPAATTIGEVAFGYCTALTSVSLPSATNIGIDAFGYCTALTSVSLPSATTIGDYAFRFCDALTSVSFPAATDIGNGSFYQCGALTSVLFPAATTIGYDAFRFCDALTSVSFPAATTIGQSVFSGCTSLTSVDFGDTPRSSVHTLGISAFRGVPTSCKIIVPDEQYDEWIAASGWSDLVTAGYKFLKHSEWEYARKYEIAGKVDSMENVSWEDLKLKRDNGELVPGSEYRITNYWATSNGDMNSRAERNQFDIIVVADATNVLNETARAIRHEGDIYFPAETKFEAWRLQYCLGNDTSRFAWAVADANGGRGVIYRMVDEFENDVPYDFKGIQFQRWAITNVTSTKLTQDAVTGYINRFVYASNGGKCFAYTNSNISVNGTVMTVDSSTSAYYYTFDSGNGLVDYSLYGSSQSVYGNIVREYLSSGKAKLNSIVFLGGSCYSNTFGDRCYSNTFGGGCGSNTFGNECCYNTFGNYCHSNTFGDKCYSKTFGNYCDSNTFGNYCDSNTFGNNCEFNTFGDRCNYNTFGDRCYSNTFGDRCYSNTFGDRCGSNTFGNECYSNTFGNRCYSNTFGTSFATKSYCRYITVESGNKYINLNITGTTSSSAYYQNVEIKSGVNNTSTYKTITDPNVNQTFHTTYQPNNSQVIEVE